MSETAPETLTFDGHLCIAEQAVVLSEEPGPWISPATWMKLLTRMGVDRPRERAHHFIGHVAVFLQRPHPFLCRCGHSEMAFTKPHYASRPKTRVVDLDPWTVNTKPEITLLIGQCPTCRRVLWGRVALQGVKTPAWFSTQTATCKTALVNGPPRRLI